MTNRDFTDPNVRAEYFKPSKGRPSDDLIIKTIRKRITAILPHHEPSYVYTSAQLCLEIWDQYPDQHRYIGQRIKYLIANGLLPIRKVSERGEQPVLYALNL